MQYGKLLAVASIVMGLSSAQAADLNTKIPLVTKAPPLVQPNPWYLMGGAGFVFSGEGDAVDRNCSNTVQLPCGFSSRQHADNTVGWIAGVGYRFTPWLRAELRLLSFKMDVRGRIEDNVPAAGVFPTTNWSTYRATAGFAVGFLDLAGFYGPNAFGGFEPYVGAGIGAARNRVSDVRYSPDMLGGAVINMPNGSNTDFAWMLTAGFGYRLTAFNLPNLLLDIGYVYADFGDALSGAGMTSGFATFQSNGFTSHARGQSVNVALRFEF